MRRFALLLLVSGLGLALALPAAASARTFNVRAGQSIQGTVDRAHAGDTIFVRPGVYHEQGVPCPSEAGRTCAVAITDDGISLIGRPKTNKPVVIENAGDQDQGVAVGRTGDASCLNDASQRVHGSLISNVQVNGFEDDGVFLFCVDDWRVTNVAAHDDAEYGIFPSHVGAGRVDNSIATGANDTGIYIGQSHDVEIDHNVATRNVSGFEIENSKNVRAHDNEAFRNTGGILTFTLPFLDVKANENNEVDHNRVHDNNKRNTCLDPSDAVCAVPRGTGILNVAADRNRIHDNTVTGNDTFGIAVANFCTGSPQVCQQFTLDIDPNPDGNRIVSNRVTHNGGNPDPSILSIFAVDLAWDFTGIDNCWAGNLFNSSFPPSLPACP
jgi:parallel beta-helix repeat protein